VQHLYYKNKRVKKYFKKKLKKLKKNTMQETEREVVAAAIIKNLNEKSVSHLDLNFKGNNPPKLVPFVHYVTAKIEGKTVKFIDNKAKKVGMQSFDKNGLAKGKPFIIASVALLYGVIGTPTANDDSAIVDFDTAAPEALINGDFKIEQDGRPTVLELPLDVMHNPNPTNTTLDREFKVNSYPVLKAEDTLEMTAELPATLAGGSDHYAKVLLRGYFLAN